MRILLLILTAVVLSSCGPAQWDRYTGEHGGYTVLMPQVPTFKTRVLHGDGVPDIKLHHMVFSQSGTGIEYAALSVEMRPETFSREQIVFQNIKTGLVRGASSTEGEKPTSVNGVPGIEISFEKEKRKTTTRVILRNHIVYAFGVAALPEYIVAKDRTKFFDSIVFCPDPFCK